MGDGEHQRCNVHRALDEFVAWRVLDMAEVQVRLVRVYLFLCVWQETSRACVVVVRYLYSAT